LSLVAVIDVGLTGEATGPLAEPAPGL